MLFCIQSTAFHHSHTNANVPSTLSDLAARYTRLSFREASSVTKTSPGTSLWMHGASAPLPVSLCFSSFSVEATAARQLPLAIAHGYHHSLYQLICAITAFTRLAPRRRRRARVRRPRRSSSPGSGPERHRPPLRLVVDLQPAERGSRLGRAARVVPVNGRRARRRGRHDRRPAGRGAARAAEACRRRTPVTRLATRRPATRHSTPE